MGVYCTKCLEDIDQALYDRWSRDNPNFPTDFEFKCPKCGVVLDISVEPVPEFHIMGVKS